MTEPTTRSIGSALIGLSALVAAAMSRSPEPAVVAAPFLTIALVTTLALRPPTVRGAVVVQPRILQGERVPLTIELGPSGRGRARVELELPDGLGLAGGEGTLEVLLEPRPSSLELDVVAERWGLLPPVRVVVTSTDLLGGSRRLTVLHSEPIQVLPREEVLRGLVAPRALRQISGVHLSRQRGDGIEYVDGRQFHPGDRARDVNWRVSARRDELWVDQRRPERSGEVVLFLDTFVSVGDTVENTLRRSVEVAGALARRHIAANDRVGLVDLGGVLRWVRAGGGTAQLYRIVDTLIATELFASGADKSVDVLPPRSLPRRCLVVAVTPLVDPRGVDAIRTLRARGFDVAAIEVSPDSFLPHPRSDRSMLARRLWSIERAAVRTDLRHRGVAVAEWRPDEPLDPLIDALGLFRTAVLRAAR